MPLMEISNWNGSISRAPGSRWDGGQTFDKELGDALAEIVPGMFVSPSLRSYTTKASYGISVVEKVTELPSSR